MRKHTPGPWVSRDNRVFRGGKCICSNVNAASPTPQSIEKDVAMSIANARLMAAAPELLDALVALVECEQTTPELWEAARAEIAKATA